MGVILGGRAFEGPAIIHQDPDHGQQEMRSPCLWDSVGDNSGSGEGLV